mmetsp:Transcript_14001/g.41198  ORF Transcript_14001/g.41198 Transcript_14001/m.41198 type:complete len:380 (+) Transcript_14001:29-1168(+)
MSPKAEDAKRRPSEGATLPKIERRGSSGVAVVSDPRHKSESKVPGVGKLSRGTSTGARRSSAGGSSRNLPATVPPGTTPKAGAVGPGKDAKGRRGSGAGEEAKRSRSTSRRSSLNDPVSPGSASKSGNASGLASPRGADQDGVPTLAVAVRSRTWEEQRRDKIEELRAAKLQAELDSLQPFKAKPSSKWKHVKSAIKKKTEEKEAEKRKVKEDAVLKAQRELMESRMAQVRHEVEARLFKEAHDEDAETRHQIHLMVEEENRRKKAQLNEQQRQEEERRQAEERRIEEIRTAFGEKGLERRQSMPSKMVFRVADTRMDITNEYRVKDRVTRTKGVSLLMGQTLTRADDVVQCVLFDDGDFDDLAAARWWNEHKERFLGQ